MAAAIIELNSLPDAVRPASKNDDLLPVRRLRLVLVFMCRVEVRRIRFELRGTRVDSLVDGYYSVVGALCSYTVWFRSREECETRVGEAGPFGFAEKLRRQIFQIIGRDLLHQIRNFLHLVQEPRIDVR